MRRWEQRADYAWAKVGVDGQLNPAKPDAPALAALVGRYVKADPGSAPVDITCAMARCGWSARSVPRHVCRR